MAISMKTSRKWLQSFFDEPLPSDAALADALTFHSCEIEEIKPEYLDVNVLPDRAAYCLCHRGIAYELSAILKQEMNDPLRLPVPEFEKIEKMEDQIKIEIENPQHCTRYMAGLVRGVKVRPSPDWLREALESVGQRSINNVVDATNYVMLDIGQPLHAFDAALFDTHANDGYSILVRGSKKDEKITTLSGDEFELPEGTLVIVDENCDGLIGIAGVKGGKAAQITEETKDIILESANFDGSLIRKTSQRLKLWTDASQRFQNKPSPELAAYGMQAVAKLITDIAGGEFMGVVDVYDAKAHAAAARASVSVSLSKINSVLGTELTPAHVTNVFEALGFAYIHENDWFTVTPPFERRDIQIAEDLIEEVGRIIGYDQIAPVMLPELDAVPNQNRFYGIERIKDYFTARGFTEISTQTFATEGEIILENPLDQTKPALRTSLVQNMEAALARAKNVAPRVLGIVNEVKLFEIGSVFKKNNEHLSLVLGVEFISGKKTRASLEQTVADFIEAIPSLEPEDVQWNDMVAEISLAHVDFDSPLKFLQDDEDTDDSLQKITLGVYKPFSMYPFALRDIAVWTPSGTEQTEVENLIVENAGELLARIDLFDRFEKPNADGSTRISYAFRLVFESMDRTLSDEDLNPLMEKITTTLNAKDGWEVR